MDKEIITIIGDFPLSGKYEVLEVKGDWENGIMVTRLALKYIKEEK